MIDQPVTFSARLPNSGPYATAKAVADVAVAADELGYEALTVHDHIPRSRRQNRHFSAGSVDFVQEGQDPILYEAMTTLTFVAPLTRRTYLFPTGITLPLRDPRLLAKQAATLHDLSGGRFRLGITIGAAADEFEIMQVPFNERGRRTDEALEALRRIFDPEPLTSFEGRTVHFRDGEFYPKPRDLDIWICGKGEAALRRVARYGAGFLPAGFTVDAYRERLPILDRELADAGRPRNDVVCGIELFVSVRADAEEAVRDAASTLIYWYDDVESGRERNIVGTPEAMIDRLRAYHGLGVRHFELKFIARSLEDQVEMMGLVAAKVMPAFR